MPTTNDMSAWNKVPHTQDGGDLRIPHEAWRTVKAAGTTVNSTEAVYAANYGDFAGTEPLRYRKDPLGYVHLWGSVTKSGGAPAANDNILTLPKGYWPAANATTMGYFFSCPTNKLTGAAGTPSIFLVVNVQTGSSAYGTLQIRFSAAGLAAGDRIVLDPICFRAEDDDLRIAR